MLDCPSCGKPVDGEECGYCGHRERPKENPAPVRAPRMTPEERARARELAAPHIAKCKEILGRPRKPGHILGGLAGLALAAIDQDPEAEAERRALRDGL